MLGFFERQRLAKKGITPQKTRRRLTQSEVVETLEHGVITRVALVLAAAATLMCLLAAGRQTVARETYAVALLIFSTATGHLCLNRREVWNCNSRLLLTFLIVLGHLALAKLCALQSAEAVHGNGGQFSALQQRDMWQIGRAHV